MKYHSLSVLVVFSLVWIGAVVLSAEANQHSRLFAGNVTQTRSNPAPVGNSCSIKSSKFACGHSLVCVNGECSRCSNNAQCQQVFGDAFECHDSRTAGGNTCKHKNLFPSVSARDVSSLLLSCLGGAFAASSGLGGGGIFVPIFIAIGDFATSMAIPLSKAMIFGAAIANFIMFFPRSHPLERKRPLIDYDSAMLLEPATLLGTIIGVLLNIVLPDYVTLALLAIILTLTTIRTLHKGYKKWRMEDSAKAMYNSSTRESLLENYTALPTVDDGADLMDEHSEERGASSQRSSQAHSNQEGSDSSQSESEFDSPYPSKKAGNLLKKDQRFFPLEKFFALSVCWLVVFGLSLLKGGHGSPTILPIRVCSAVYWVVSFIPFPVVGAFMLIIGFFLIVRHRRKLRANYPFLEGDVRWNLCNTFVYPLFSFLAGIAAGCVGIGGGLLKGPLLSEMGLLSEVTVATSSFMILFTSSITTVQFTILGRLPFDYGIVFALCGFFSALIGQLTFEYIVKKLNRPSLLVIVMGGVIAVSTLLMTGVGISRLLREIEGGAYMGINMPC